MAEKPKPSYFPGAPGGAKALLGNPPAYPAEGGPALKELGAENQSAGGIGGWAAFIDEAEFVPELTWPTSITTYHRMRSDSQIEALHLGTVSPIREYRWSIDPNKAPKAIVEAAAADLGLPIKGEEDEPIKRSAATFNFDAFLDDALLGPLYGHFHFEIVGEMREASEWRMVKLAPRHPRTIMEFQSDTTGTLLGIRQNIPGAAGWATMPPPIPAFKLIPLVWRPEAGSFVGRSMLRSLYREWLVKDRTMRIAAINLERAGGVPVAYGAQGASDEQLRDLAQLARQFKVAEGAGGALPFGSKLELVGGHVPDAISLLKYCDECMARVWALMLLQLGMTQTGNRALGAEFAAYAARAQRAIAKWFATKVNAFLDRYVEWNEPLADYAPLLSFEQSKPDAMSVTDLVSLISAGALVVDPELEEWLRSEYGLPERPADHPAAGELDREAQEVEIENKKNPPSFGEGQPPPKLPSLAQDATADTPTLASLKTARGRFGITRLHRGVRATVTLPARELRRPPSDNEIRAAVDFRQLDLNHSDVTAGLQEAILGDILPAQIEDVANQIRRRKDGNPRARFGAADVGRLTAPSLGQATIHEHLIEAAEHGARAARREAENQGMRNLATVDRAVLAPRIADQATAVADLNANGVTLAAQRHALQLVNRGYTPQQIALELEAHLKGQKHVWERQQARGAVTMAQNQGRIAQMVHHEAVVGDPGYQAAQALVKRVDDAVGGPTDEAAYDRARAIVDQGPMHPSTAAEVLKGDLGGVDELAKERAEEIVAAPVDVEPVYEASEILDNRTCDACAAIDGTVFDDLDAAESAYGGGGYVNCEGGPNCRGTLVAIYPEQNPESAGGRVGEGEVPYIQPEPGQAIEQAAQEVQDEERPMGLDTARFMLEENARSPGRFNDEAVIAAEDKLGSEAATVKRAAEFRAEAEKLAPDVAPVPVTAELFREMLAQAMAQMTPNDRGHLTLHPVETYGAKGAKTFLADGGNIGGAVMPDGELVSLFNVGKIRGGGMQMLEHLKAEGGWHLEAMGQRLRDKYRKHGFVETGFVKWDKQYAPPEWDYRKGGHPNIYTMRLPPKYGPIEPGEQGIFPGVTPPGPRPREGLDAKPGGVGEWGEARHEATYEKRLETADVENLTQNEAEGISRSYKGEVAGEKVIYKPEAGSGGSAGRETIDGSIPAERERATYLVAQAMDSPAPALVLREQGLVDGYGSVGRFVPDSRMIGEVARFVYDDAPLSEQDLHDIAVLDWVVGNTDRHGGNAMVVRNHDPHHVDSHGGTAQYRVVPIDHNLTFPEVAGREGGNFNFGDTLPERLRKITDEDVTKLRNVLAHREELITDAKLPERHVALMEARINQLIQDRRIPDGHTWPDAPAGAKAQGVPAPPPRAAVDERQRLESLVRMKNERIERIERDGGPSDPRIAGAVEELQEAKRHLEELRAPGEAAAPAQSRELPGFNEAADRFRWEQEKRFAERRAQAAQDFLDAFDKGEHPAGAVEADRPAYEAQRDKAIAELSKLEAEKPPLPMDKAEAERVMLRPHVEKREAVDRAMEVLKLPPSEAEQRIALARQHEIDGQMERIEKQQGPDFGKVIRAAERGDEGYVNEVLTAFKNAAKNEGRQWYGGVWEARDANVREVLDKALGRFSTPEPIDWHKADMTVDEARAVLRGAYPELARQRAAEVLRRAGAEGAPPEVPTGRIEHLPVPALEAIRKGLIREGKEAEVARVEKIIERKQPGWNPGMPDLQSAWENERKRLVKLREDAVEGGHLNAVENLDKRLHEHLANAPGERGAIAEPMNLNRAREVLREAREPEPKVTPGEIAKAKEIVEPARPIPPQEAALRRQVADAQDRVVQGERMGAPADELARYRNERWQAEEALREHLVEPAGPGGPPSLHKFGPPTPEPEPVHGPISRELLERMNPDKAVQALEPPPVIKEAQALVANPLHYGAAERLPKQVLLDEWARWQNMDGAALKAEQDKLPPPEQISNAADRDKYLALKQLVEARANLETHPMSVNLAKRVLRDAQKPPAEQFFLPAAIERAQKVLEDAGERPSGQAVPRERVPGAQPGTPGEWRWARAVVANPTGAAAEDVEAAKMLLGRPSQELDAIRKQLGIGQGEAYGVFGAEPDWKHLAIAARDLLPVLQNFEVREAKAALTESIGSLAEKSHNQVLVSDFGKWQGMSESQLSEERERRAAEGHRIPVLLEHAIEQRRAERLRRELLDRLAAQQ